MIAQGRSLWLVPAEPERRRLDRWIAEAADRFGGPSFPSHLTLLAGIDPADSPDAGTLTLLAGRLTSLRLPVIGVDTYHTYFQAVFLIFHRQALDPLLATVRASLGDLGSPPFRPHVSLFYGDLEQKEKEQIARKFIPQAPESIGFDRLELVNTHGPVGEWQALQQVRLGVGSR